MKPRSLLIAATAAVIFSTLAAGLPSPADAHTTTETVDLYTPLVGPSKWATTPGTEPASHHIVYSNYGYMNDISVDIFAPAGTKVVSPFASKASNGQATVVTVISVVPGCKSGKVSDGGYRVTLEVKNKVTGVILGRADLMHVNNPQVRAGQQVGPWTTLGYTAQFGYSTCYQVRTPQGVHVHAEFINKHRYACYIWRANGTAINENTKIGKVAGHYGGQRATC